MANLPTPEEVGRLAATLSDPLRVAAREIEAQAQANFEAKFGYPIAVKTEILEDEAGKSHVAFSFTLAKPGMLPTKIEREWFDGFIVGYRCCCSVFRYLLEPPPDVTPS